MVQKYATEAQICEALAAYKVGDIVTLLHNEKNGYGVIEAGTKLCISKVTLNPMSDYPKDILYNELDSYYATFDSGVFLYGCYPIDDKGEPDKDFYVPLRYYEIEKCDNTIDVAEKCREKTKKRNSIQNKICIINALAFVILSAAMFALFWIIFPLEEIPSAMIGTLWETADIVVAIILRAMAALFFALVIYLVLYRNVLPNPSGKICRRKKGCALSEQIV